MSNEDVLTIEDGVVEACKQDAVDVVIPEGVKEIGYNAFSDCKALKSILLPSTLEEIAPAAFENCTSLATIKFNGTVEQWDAVNRDEDEEWASDTLTDCVICTDGEGETSSIDDIDYDDDE